MGIQNFRGLQILSGINTYPGSGPLSAHSHEIDLFDKVLDNIDHDKPCMVEVGCHWALWSLQLRQRYPQAKNIIIELGKRALLVGEKNFQLNNLSYSSYFGGLFVEQSGTYVNRAADLEYINNENDHLVEHIPTIYTDTDLIGPTLDFISIYKAEQLDNIDVFHMDIQGSEDLVVPYLIRTFLGRILNMVVATHSHDIHANIIKRLTEANYQIVDNEKFGSVGGDGYIYGKLTK